ncbi:FAP100 [Symbiodinium sp. KB8]|nr:FAP100 [Symbiodinium sp. KB8]
MSRAGKAVVGGTRGSAAAAAAASAGSSEAAGSNPFLLPTGEELFRLREIEKAKRQERKRELARVPVWQKTAEMHRAGAFKRLTEDDIPITDEAARARIAKTKRLVSAATSAMTGSKHRDRERMTDFLDKKHKMFLVQMTLDTKREEIQKLERKAQAKEEALKKSELMLEEDAIRFDAFLKENDREAFEAIKSAEAKALEKQKKQARIKELKYRCTSLANEISKLELTLEEYKGYREFLVGLTPPAWLDERREEKAARQEARRMERFNRRHREWADMRDAIERRVRAEVESARKRAIKEGRAPPETNVAAVVASRLAGHPEPRAEDEEGESSGEDLPMYFERPEQLLEQFKEKENENLFLIQHNQQIEQQLEELRAQLRSTEAAMTAQTTALESGLEGLKAQIRDEEAKADDLVRRVSKAAGDGAQEAMLEKLGERIDAVYKACVGDTTSRPSRIDMLTKLEGKLESLLATISMMPRAYVAKMEKELESRRRKQKQKERKQQQEDLQRHRLELSIQRSAAPAKKPKGKPLMFRSAPIKKKVKKEKPDPEKIRELEEMRFLT